MIGGSGDDNRIEGGLVLVNLSVFCSVLESPVLSYPPNQSRRKTRAKAGFDWEDPRVVVVGCRGLNFFAVLSRAWARDYFFVAYAD